MSFLASQTELSSCSSLGMLVFYLFTEYLNEHTNTYLYLFHHDSLQETFTPSFYLRVSGHVKDTACTGSRLFWPGTSLGEDAIFESEWLDGCAKWFDAIREKPGSDVWEAIALFRSSLRTVKVEAILHFMIGSW
jgi:hypothetical protein